MYGDPMGVIGGRLYEVLEVYGDPMGVILGRLYEFREVFGHPRAPKSLGWSFEWIPKVSPQNYSKM